MAIKSPAINWYFDNWIGGVKGFSRLQKACYFDVLTLQYYIGHLTLEQIKNELAADFHVWKSIEHKFITDESGNYYNVRMDTEILKRKNYSEKQSGRVKKRWENDSGIYHGNTTVIPNYEIESEIKKENSLKTNYFLKYATAEISDREARSAFDVTWNQLSNPEKPFLSMDWVRSMWRVFYGIQKDSGEYYQNESKVFFHFRNWIRKQKFDGANKKQSTSAAKEQALRNY